MLPASRHFSRCQSIGVCLALVALVLWLVLPQLHRIRSHHTGDFGHFYFAAKAMASGDEIYSSWHCGYIYPPLLAFLYMPLASLSEESAALVLLCINTSVLLLAAWVGTREFIARFGLARDMAAAGTLLLVGMVLMADKIKGELQMWQTNALLLLLFMLALRFLDRWPLRSGLALGFAFNIKYLPLLMLPYLLLRRRWLAFGSFLAGIGLFAFLPAPVIGWDVNLRYLVVAYRGVFRLFGVHVGPEQGANIADIRSAMSVSITSALARALPSNDSLLVPYAIVGLVGLSAAGVAFWMYRRQDLAVVYRPDGAKPNDPAARVLTAIEWTGLIVVALVFSPQTNTRHLVLLLPVQLAAAVLVMAPHAAIPRLPLALGMLLLTLGMVLPPGGAGYDVAVHFWHSHGGPCWCALAMYGTLLWTGLRYASAFSGGS